MIDRFFKKPWYYFDCLTCWKMLILGKFNNALSINNTMIISMPKFIYPHGTEPSDDKRVSFFYVLRNSHIIVTLLR